jgi:CDP-6-deoxy-D-xylo-4-hexulose-3-dehydrase
VYGEEEVEAGVSAMLDFWLTLGPEGERAERALERYLGVKKTILVNSGSSANLVAFSALTSPKLGDRRILPGDEVITAAGGFPTTVFPIIQNGAVPVFVDNDVRTGNLRVDMLDAAYVPGRTKAVMVAHTLGNPFDLDEVVRFCRERNLWLVEDNCDALGSLWNGRFTGTFGDLSTQSFYPPHHITMGEGGAINIVHDKKLKVIIDSIRDWGRDCWCASGCDNTCNKRFGWQLGELPFGYDHKYIYSHLGYNLKPLDLQAAIGTVQVGRLEEFGMARRRNWALLRTSLDDLQEKVAFMEPEGAAGWNASIGSHTFVPGKPASDPSWFGFMVRILPGSGLARSEVVRYLERHKVGNRMLFGGNLVRQPVFTQLADDYHNGLRPRPFRVVGDLKGADTLMEHAFFVGAAPNQTEETMAYQVKVIREALGAA